MQRAPSQKHPVVIDMLRASRLVTKDAISAPGLLKSLPLHMQRTETFAAYFNVNHREDTHAPLDSKAVMQPYQNWVDYNAGLLSAGLWSDRMVLVCSDMLQVWHRDVCDVMQIKFNSAALAAFRKWWTQTDNYELQFVSGIVMGEYASRAFCKTARGLALQARSKKAEIGRDKKIKKLKSEIAELSASDLTFPLASLHAECSKIKYIASKENMASAGAIMCEYDDDMAKRLGIWYWAINVWSNNLSVAKQTQAFKIHSNLEYEKYGEVVVKNERKASGSAPVPSSGEAADDVVLCHVIDSSEDVGVKRKISWKEQHGQPRENVKKGKGKQAIAKQAAADSSQKITDLLKHVASVGKSIGVLPPKHPPKVRRGKVIPKKAKGKKSSSSSSSSDSSDSSD
jgi:hypothetical protein